jgi:hypothetical protein
VGVEESVEGGCKAASDLTCKWKRGEDCQRRGEAVGEVGSIRREKEWEGAG